MIVVRYVGDGAFYNGVPARDLTEADLAALSDEQRAAVETDVIYELAVEPPEEDS